MIEVEDLNRMLMPIFCNNGYSSYGIFKPYSCPAVFLMPAVLKQRSALDMKASIFAGNKKMN